MHQNGSRTNRFATTLSPSAVFFNNTPYPPPSFNTQSAMQLSTPPGPNSAFLSDSFNHSPPHLGGEIPDVEFSSSTLPHNRAASRHSSNMAAIDECPAGFGDLSPPLERTVSFPDSSVHDSCSYYETDSLQSPGIGLAVSANQSRRVMAARRSSSCKSALSNGGKPNVFRGRNSSSNQGHSIDEEEETEFLPPDNEIADTIF